MVLSIHVCKYVDDIDMISTLPWTLSKAKGARLRMPSTNSMQWAETAYAPRMIATLLESFSHCAEKGMLGIMTEFLVVVPQQCRSIPKRQGRCL